MPKFANQRIVTIGERENRIPYAKISIEAMRKASELLSGEEFRLWCYLDSNADGHSWDLSPAMMAKEWAIKKSTYYDGWKRLLELGYLEEQGGNSFVFHEWPVSKEQIEISVPKMDPESQPVEVSKSELRWEF